MIRNYADYTFYVTEYNQNMTEAEFNDNILEATAYIRRLTMRKSDNSKCVEVKYATCAVVEVYRDLKKEYPSKRIVASENNDGFSQSFVTSGQSYDRVKNERSYKAAKLWLSGTGLLSRRCKIANKC